MTRRHREHILEQVNQRVSGEMRRSLASMPELPVRLLAKLVLDTDDETAKVAQANPTWLIAVLELSIAWDIPMTDLPLSWWAEMLSDDD